MSWRGNGRELQQKSILTESNIKLLQEELEKMEMKGGKKREGRIQKLCNEKLK